MPPVPEVLTAKEAAEFLRTRPETLKRLARARSQARARVALLKR